MFKDPRPCKYRPWVLIATLLLLMISLQMAAAGILNADPSEQKRKEMAELVIGEDPVGKPLKDFSGVTVDGQNVSSTDMRGKVLLIDLWGVNCGSCLDEMKALEGIYHDFRDLGLVVWAVNTEQHDGEEIRGGLQLKQMSISYTLLVDPELEITRIFTSWFIPVTVIVDRKGIVQYYKIGFSDSDSAEVRGILGELLK
ncbi:MAG: TlpA family protein disulfide reductase [Deltaproteobacteria bacterium]|nr:TlpA family protein disulfide reductase [Deltaproteobacteria bacterium]